MRSRPTVMFGMVQPNPLTLPVTVLTFPPGVVKPGGAIAFRTVLQALGLPVAAAVNNAGNEMSPALNFTDAGTEPQAGLELSIATVTTEPHATAWFVARTLPALSN